MGILAQDLEAVGEVVLVLWAEVEAGVEDIA
jgi:hypothetical protein